MFCRLGNASLKQCGFLCSLYHPGTVFPAMLKGTELKNPPQKGAAPFTKVLMHFLGKNYTHLYLDIEIFFPSLFYVKVYNTPEYQNKTAKQNMDNLCSHSVLLRSKSIFLSTFFFLVQLLIKFAIYTNIPLFVQTWHLWKALVQRYCIDLNWNELPFRENALTSVKRHGSEYKWK